MSAPLRRAFVAGRWLDEGSPRPVLSPWDGTPVAEVIEADEAALERALVAAESVRRSFGRTTSGQRRAWLTAIATGLAARREEFARAIALEAGKPIRLARLEVSRAVETFTLAAAEVTARRGELIPVDLDDGSAAHRCVVEQVPAGIVIAISPFNFPLNLASHKVAPALAVGAPVLLKPPPQAPSATLLLAELAQQAGLPDGALSVLPCSNALSERLATDRRARIVSFTGSAKVGWALARKVSGKALLELGGNAAALVAEDADLDRAATRLAGSAFNYAGQVCISTQRIYVVRSRFEPFVERLLTATSALRLGDPMDEATAIGPVIDTRAADRIEAAYAEAEQRGARLLLRGSRTGNLLSPTIATAVPTGCALHDEELFGPGVLVEPVDSADEGLARIDAGPWGLQAAVFTRDTRLALQAFERLEVGGVVIDDAPSFRSDAMPYGGVKGSGLGREGVRSAMQEFSEPRALVLTSR